MFTYAAVVVAHPRHSGCSGIHSSVDSLILYNRRIAPGVAMLHTAEYNSPVSHPPPPPPTKHKSAALKLTLTSVQQEDSVTLENN